MAKLQVARKIKTDGPLLIAVSGGIDSMVTLDFFVRSQGVENMIALFYKHSNDMNADKEYSFVASVCAQKNIAMSIGFQNEIYKSGSLEKFWRDGRRKFFEMHGDMVITGHHLDDAVEWYLFTSFRGDAKVMPYKTGNTIKPFILHKKEDFYEYAEKYDVKYIEDETNADPEFGSRNAIRNNILPEVLKINPGIHTVVKKKIMENIIMAELSE